jgi:GxxExxY protein
MIIFRHIGLCQGLRIADLRTPPGPEGSNGSLLCICRSHPGISLKLAARERKERKRAVKTINELCDVVRQTAYDIHVYHSNGHMEKVYENALAHRLRKLGLEVKQQHPLKVYDEDGTVIGEYLADLFIDGRLIIELKAARTLVDEHIAQMLGYLRASRIEHGLLINFGSYRFEIRKYVLSQGEPREENRISVSAVSESSLSSLRSLAAKQ